MCGVAYPKIGSKWSFGGFKKVDPKMDKMISGTARVKISKKFKCSFVAIANIIYYIYFH